MAVRDTHQPLKVPVGSAILSRMFNVFGNAIDRLPAPEGVQWRTVHHSSPPLARRSTKSEIFETGIKIIKCSFRYSRWKSRLAWRRWGGQDSPAD